MSAIEPRLASLSSRASANQFYVPSSIADSVTPHWLGAEAETRLATFYELLVGRFIALFVLLLTLPIFLAIAMAIKLDSRGGVFYRQLRYGLNGLPFYMYKFRTMRTDSSVLHSDRQTRVNDPRVSRLGRFLRRSSLDELPQLLNVLRGEMALVGPRPHAVGMRIQNELALDLAPRYLARYRVLPGITGWAQIHGVRGPLATSHDLEERLRYDFFYIKKRSWLFDLKILLSTPIEAWHGLNAI